MKKIMAVDDETNILLILKLLLQREGFEVITVKSGQECLDKLEEIKPDIILMDVMMPGLDGWETCKKIKENEKTKAIPVLMLTVRTSDNSRQKSLGYACADGHLCKPMSRDALVEEINALLEIS
jgi:DNA-binding response OmpR family regulator